MSRYISGADLDFEPGSRKRVLRNLLGVKSVREMQRIEHEALFWAQQRSYEQVEEDQTFTVEMIRQMHRDWLGEIYPFAGELRTIDLTAPAQGPVPAFRFSHAAYLEANFAGYETERLARLTPCRATSVSGLSESLAEAHAEFIVIHPFREGNGRVGRWLTELMALQAGFPAPDHGFANRGGKALRQEYYNAMSVALHRADYALLAQHYSDAIERGGRSFRPRRRT